MAMLHPFDPSINKARQNPDGTVSTEKTRTVRLPDGSWANIPSLWWGDGDVVQDLDRFDDDQLSGMAQRYEAQTGNKFPRFSDLSEAEKAAQQRSHDGGGEYGAIAGPGNALMGPNSMSGGNALSLHK